MNKTIQSVIKYLSPMKKFNKVTFETEFNSIPLCNYDSSQIQHLLVHLFTNSVEVKQDVTIKVKTAADENSVKIEIKDNGPGFPEERIDNPFELRSEKGSGYGLFLCKSIIDQHNGEIEILKTDEGAGISFSLPIV